MKFPRLHLGQMLNTFDVNSQTSVFFVCCFHAFSFVESAIDTYFLSCKYFFLFVNMRGANLSVFNYACFVVYILSSLLPLPPALTSSLDECANAGSCLSVSPPNCCDRHTCCCEKYFFACWLAVFEMQLAAVLVQAEVQIREHIQREATAATAKWWPRRICCHHSRCFVMTGRKMPHNGQLSFV